MGPDTDTDRHTHTPTYTRNKTAERVEALTRTQCKNGTSECEENLCAPM